MKLTIMTPRQEFSQSLQKRLKQLGAVSYTKTRSKYSLKSLEKLCQGSSILGIDPDNLGGFEVAKKTLNQLISKLPDVKHLALSTTSYGYIDFSLMNSRSITVSNVPNYSRESVAEHTIAMLLNLSKRILITERRTISGKYQITEGFELKGKTLGVIGFGSIGSRVAELCLGLGMKVIAYNRTPKHHSGVTFESLTNIVSKSDAISLHLAHTDKTEGLISKDLISKFKPGVIIINTADRSLIDEHALASAIKSGLVDSYSAEVEDLTSPPLGKLENAILIKSYGWYTREALENNKKIWVDNMVNASQGKFTTKVN
jgi:lactate dehydrogenase-like 2-hydroxyacid dehydrogenase